MAAIGDNKEWGVAAISDVTVHLGNHSGLTSADDVAATVYFDSNSSRSAFCLRSDQACQIVSIDDTTFTDPLTCPINGSVTEKELVRPANGYSFSKMVIRTTVVNTNLKLRVRGGI